MTDTTTPGPGHNALIDVELLRIQNMAQEETLAELEAKAETVPDIIDDDATSGPWQDVIKDFDDLAKTLETRREDAKAPVLEAGRIVDGYFKALSNRDGTPGRLQRARYKIANVVSAYLQRKEIAARREREAEAARAREEERKAREAAAEAQRRADEARRKDAAERQQRAAEDHNAKADVAGAQAFELEQQAQAKPAEFARTRSDAGSVATLNVTWDFEITDIDRVKADKLWAYVSRADKEKAIRAFIRAQAPKQIADDANWQPIPGVNFLRKRGLQVR